MDMKRLREVADPIDQQILDEIFDYEAGIDGEFACCHSAKQIEAGAHGWEDPIRAVALIAERYGLEWGA